MITGNRQIIYPVLKAMGYYDQSDIWIPSVFFGKQGITYYRYKEDVTLTFEDPRQETLFKIKYGQYL